ncbi:MAG TPA: endolytic transglycosylase MltG [Syntrophobacteraceae bacterium]|nr:endolytic transglycosylase MltG [Syntrophobacteraceae bacterium]
MGRGRRYVLWGCFCLVSLIGLSAVAAGLVCFRFWLFLRLPPSVQPGVRWVEVRPGMGAMGIARLLRENGVVADAVQFRVLCWIRKGDQKLKAGEYAFSTLLTPEQVLDHLVHGRVFLHRLTIPEGSTLRDTARIIGEKHLASPDEVLRLSADPDFVRSLGLDSPSLEGYLYPDTYLLPRSSTASSILKAMVQQFRTRFPEEWKDRVSQSGLSVREVVILASMVEKEAVVDAERPVIAAVFFNRLKLGMPLQSDPTAVYDLDGFTGPITSAHLKRASPYNTYVNVGLPPGPICSPGSKSIKAVLYPEKVDHLYFVSNQDGTHHFSTTLGEHNEAVSRYLRKLKESRKQDGPESRAKTPSEQESVPGDSKPATGPNKEPDRKKRSP